MKSLLTVLALMLALPLLADEWEVRSGNYIVPAPHDLSTVSSFPSTFRTTVANDGKATLTYHLPAEIVGPDAPMIVLKETTKSLGMVHYSGELGEASCRRVAESLTCFVIYPALEIDDKKVDRYIEDNYTDKTEIDLRKQLARVFSNDPKGIVNYSRK